VEHREPAARQAAADETNSGAQAFCLLAQRNLERSEYQTLQTLDLYF
jgi:hypothetical protein